MAGPQSRQTPSPRAQSSNRNILITKPLKRGSSLCKEIQATDLTVGDIVQAAWFSLVEITGTCFAGPSNKDLTMLGLQRSSVGSLILPSVRVCSRFV